MSASARQRLASPREHRLLTGHGARDFGPQLCVKAKKRRPWTCAISSDHFALSSRACRSSSIRAAAIDSSLSQSLQNAWLQSTAYAVQPSPWQAAVACAGAGHPLNDHAGGLLSDGLQRCVSATVIGQRRSNSELATLHGSAPRLPLALAAWAFSRTHRNANSFSASQAASPAAMCSRWRCSAAERCTSRISSSRRVWRHASSVSARCATQAKPMQVSPQRPLPAR